MLSVLLARHVRAIAPREDTRGCNALADGALEKCLWMDRRCRFTIKETGRLCVSKSIHFSNGRHDGYRLLLQEGCLANLLLAVVSS
jgi:hypothetical protein